VYPDVPDLYRLYVFLVVVEAGSISGAAARLHLSQTAVYQQIRSLERKLGLKLFYRQGGRRLPTEAAEALIGPTRELLAHAERYQSNLETIRGRLGGLLKVGVGVVSAEAFLPRLLAGFRVQLPACSPQMILGDTVSLAGMLGRGELDLAFLGQQLGGRQVDLDLLFQEELVAVVSDRHPWARRRRVVIADLEQVRLILPGPGHGTRQTLESALARRGCQLKPDQVWFEASSLQALAVSLQAEPVVGILPASAARQIGPQFKILRFGDLSVRQPIFIGRSRALALSPVAAQFYEFVTGPEGQRLLPSPVAGDE
jgi:DNA-binding transcriptional LysR family regulator